MACSRKKILLLTALVVATMIGAALSAAAQGMKDVPEAAVAAAKGAFEQILSVTRRTGTLEVLGMRSEADTAAAELGAPVRMLEIGYDLLVAHRPTDPPQSVFVAREQVLFPIVADKRARSLLTLAKAGDEWRMTSYGDPDRAAAIEASKNSLSKVKGVSADQTSAFSLLTAPAFQLDMMAVTQAQKNYVIPLNPVTAAEYGIEGIMELPAAVSQLSDYAKTFDAKYGEQIRQRRLAK